jgi:hypothetical protein
MDLLQIYLIISKRGKLTMEGKDGQREVEYREKRAKQEQQGRARSCFQVQGQTASSSVGHVQRWKASHCVLGASRHDRLLDNETDELRWLLDNRA